MSPFGPFVNKNHFAGWVAMAALLVAGLALGLADGARGRRGDWTTDPRAGGVILGVVAALAMALAGLASLSRGGAAALVAGAACLAALRFSRGGSPRRRSGLLPSLVLAAVLGSILVALVPPEAHERLRTLSGASFRLDTWRDSLRLAASSPVVGQGLGAFHDAYPRFKRGHGIVRVEHAENDYLETLAETGAAGLALAVAGLALLLGAAGRGIATGPDRLVRGVGTGAAAALVAVAVHSAVDFNLRIPSNAALAALAAAAAAGGGGRSVAAAAPLRRARPLGRRARAARGRGVPAGSPVARGTAGGGPGRLLRGARRSAFAARARRGGSRAASPAAPRASGVVAPPGRHARGAGRRGLGRGARPARRLARSRASRSRRGRGPPRRSPGRPALTPTAGLG